MSTDRIAKESEHYGREAITRLFELQLRAGSTAKTLGELAQDPASEPPQEKFPVRRQTRGST